MLCLGCFLCKLVIILCVFDPFHGDRRQASAALFFMSSWLKRMDLEERD